MAGVGAGVFLFIMVFAFAFLAFAIFCLWKIFTKAGLSGALSLLVLIPGVGWIIVLCMLAFMDWKVTPLPQGFSGLPPGGYAPPSYPSPYQAQPTTPTYPQNPPPPTTPL